MTTSQCSTPTQAQSAHTCRGFLDFSAAQLLCGRLDCTNVSFALTSYCGFQLANGRWEAITRLLNVSNRLC